MNYSEYLDYLNSINPKITEGDNIVYLLEYTLFKGVALKVNKKSIKVKIPPSFWFKEQIKNVPFEKVLKQGTPAVLVWEMWKGTNGRGGYRLDTYLYKDKQILVEKIPPISYIYEESFLFI